jgi:hypothetical protein
MQANLLIAYEVNGKAVAIGRVRNPRLLRQAANQAVSEKRNEVLMLGRINPGLAVIGEGELQSLQHSLDRLVPGMRRPA